MLTRHREERKTVRRFTRRGTTVSLSAERGRRRRFLLRCVGPELARTGSSPQRGEVPAIELEADGRRRRPGSPRLTRNVHSRQKIALACSVQFANTSPTDILRSLDAKYRGIWHKWRQSHVTARHHPSRDRFARIIRRLSRRSWWLWLRLWSWWDGNYRRHPRGRSHPATTREDLAATGLARCIAKTIPRATSRGSCWVRGSDQHEMCDQLHILLARRRRDLPLFFCGAGVRTWPQPAVRGNAA
jgi:hypothetical protein